MKTRKGYTLVEILVVIGIFAIVAVMGTMMFFYILKGAAKTRALAEVKQNGDYALGAMTRLIRNAKTLESWNDHRIILTDQNGESITFECVNGEIASASASLISETVEVEDCTDMFAVEEGTALTPDKVTISFTLRQAGAGRPEEKAEVDFKTTVLMRNISEE
jgi:prepilin-type N-terminal cleavage/methylation domain-containing protein